MALSPEKIGAGEVPILSGSLLIETPSPAAVAELRDCNKLVNTHMASGDVDASMKAGGLDFHPAFAFNHG